MVPYQVGDPLPDIEWHLQSFAGRSHGAATVQDFKESIEGGNHQLWTVEAAGIQAVVLTQISADRNETVTITHCAGQGHNEWCDLVVSTIAGWAKERGSTGLSVVCRKGWERPLSKLGFKATHIIMELR